MDVELLVVADCPNERAATVLLRRALDDIGQPSAPVRTVVVTDQQQAEGLGFTGSPTIRINGADPFDEPGRPVGLSCRVYRTTAGLAGLPELGRLRHALEQAAGSAARRNDPF